VTQEQFKLREGEQASLEALKGMGKSEEDALEFIKKQRRERATKHTPTTERRELRDLDGKRTVLMLTESEAASFDALRGYGKSNKEAVALIERKAGGRLMSVEESRRQLRRSAFSNLKFRPFNKEVCQ
jgi:hypothetical protein